MLIVSPHLDDAVLSCGALLSANPGCQVITVFAGTPADTGQATDWDRRCGFDSAGEAMAIRRREDEKALGILGAYPVWLDFLDSQYGGTADLNEVSRMLCRAIDARRATAKSVPVLLPLGLFHSDHSLAHDAGRAALATLFPATPHAATLRWFAYEDSPYRGNKGVLQRRLAELASAGVVATPWDPATLSGVRSGEGVKLDAKRAALAAYASQLRGFGEGGYEDAWRPERFWTLECDWVATHD